MVLNDIRWYKRLAGFCSKIQEIDKKNNFLGAKDSLQYIGIYIAASERQE